MAPTKQSSLQSHGVTSTASPTGTSPGKRRKTDGARSAPNAPEVTPAKPPRDEDSMEEDIDGETSSKEHGATPSAESNEDSNMEETSDADATAAKEDDTEEEKAAKAAIAKK